MEVKIDISSKGGSIFAREITKNDIDGNIEAIDAALDCNGLRLVDITRLVDTKSILYAIREQLPDG